MVTKEAKLFEQFLEEFELKMDGFMSEYGETILNLAKSELNDLIQRYRLELRMSQNRKKSPFIRKLKSIFGYGNEALSNELEKGFDTNVNFPMGHEAPSTEDLVGTQDSEVGAQILAPSEDTVQDNQDSAVGAQILAPSEDTVQGNQDSATEAQILEVPPTPELGIQKDSLPQTQDNSSSDLSSQHGSTSNHLQVLETSPVPQVQSSTEHTNLHNQNSDEYYGGNNPPVEEEVSRYVVMASQINPYPEKNQDFVQTFQISKGIAGVILCDGVSNEGELSGKLARKLPSEVIARLNYIDPEYDSVSYFEEFLVQSINESCQAINLEGGATTFIIAFILRDKLYFGWIGDGNAIYFNESFTGYSKLLFPQQTRQKVLTSAVLNTGVMGKPVVNILNLQAGTIIVSSDGIDLNNGRILSHLYKSVVNPGILKDMNLQDRLDHWIRAECCEEKNHSFHPSPTDDQSIAIFHWGAIGEDSLAKASSE